MLSPSPRHTNCRLPLALGTALLAGLLLVPGCRQAAEDSSVSSAGGPQSTPDTPLNLPPVPVLFATVMAPAPPPAQQVARAPLPPRPPDAGQVAQQAVVPVSGVPVSGPRRDAAVNAGLIVCDPIPGDPALTTFGTACGRWLDLIAAGQPELGRTPYWEARGRARQEMGRADFHLTPAQAGALSGMTGATHAACGTISGVPSRCTLTYSLYALPGGQPVGPPLVQTGAEAQIVAALPGMAKALDARLGVRAPRVPPSVALSPSELTQVETIADEDAVSDADLLALSRLSARSPLAGMYYVGTRACNDQILLNGMVKTLLTQLPSNTLVLSHLGYTESRALRAYAASTRALIGRYPANALLAHTEIWEQRIWGTRAGEWQATQRVCRDAPRDPDSWLSPAATLGNIAEDLRQSRLANDLSASEWTTLRRLYGQQEQATLQATTLDPHYGHAWIELAEAATFSGDSGRADAAFDKALAQDTDKQEVYSWGLQMYQPKWGGDAAALGRVAALAVAEPWGSSNGATSAAEALKSAGYKAEAAQVLSVFITRQRAIVAKNPTDALEHWDLAAALAAQKTSPSLREASLEYRIAEHLMPNVPAIHRWLGDVLDQRGRTAEAIPEYRKALALDPFDSTVHFALGFDLKHERHFSEALTELHLAMRLDPRNADAHYGLGELLTMQHQYRPAAAEYREAIRMSFYSLGAWIGLPGALDECGLYDEAIRAGREADHLLMEQEQANGETEPMIHDATADAYLHKKDWAGSILESSASLGYNPNDACAHENLAEAYIAQGRKNAAHAEWERAIALGNPEITPVARKLLAAHP